MGTLAALRNRGTLLIGIVGFAMLAFVGGDVLISGGDLFFGQDTSVGKIGSTKVDYKDFNRLVQERIENYKTQSGLTSVDPQTTKSIVDQAWTTLVRDNILSGEMDELGVTVSGDELFDMIQGNNPNSQVRQAFTDPNTGQFNPEQVSNFLRNLDQDPTTKAQWVVFEQQLKQQRREEKYFNLISKGIFIPSTMAKADYEQKSKRVNVEFVVAKYSEIADSTVVASESDLKKHYENNKFKYQQKPSRAIEYVVFDIFASAEDTSAIVEWVENKKPEFQKSKKDSLFINVNSDKRFTGAYSKKGDLPATLDSIMFASEPGFVYGPYQEGTSFRLAKLIKVAQIPDSVKARHILIKPLVAGGADAITKADSLKILLDNGANFAALAEANSEDPGSAVQGGDLGWFGPGQMVKPFNDACFMGEKGTTVVVNSQFGVHIINIQDQSAKKKAVQVGVLEREIYASDETENQAFQLATRFLSDFQRTNDFDAVVSEAGMNKRIADQISKEQQNIPGFKDPKPILRWAFEAEKGSISDILETDDKIIVAKLTSINSEGFKAFESVKTIIEVEVKKEKKADLLSEKLSTAGNDLQSIATAMNTTVLNANDLALAYPIMTGVGREPKVAGYAMGLKTGVVSAPISGERGVYVLKVVNEQPLGEITDLSSTKAQLLNPLKQRATYESFEALKDLNKVEDNRLRYF
ncbi:MAG: peptidyl-prolyl cis-trans isomerase D [Sphingobacteriales bacterium]|jgi:peptidyl-prolyl cis-trans isomerase D